MSGSFVLSGADLFYSCHPASYPPPDAVCPSLAFPDLIWDTVSNSRRHSCVGDLVREIALKSGRHGCFGNLVREFAMKSGRHGCFGDLVREFALKSGLHCQVLHLIREMPPMSGWCTGVKWGDPYARGSATEALECRLACMGVASNDPYARQC